MKRDISTISFVIVVFAILELFFLNPAFAKKDCDGLVWEGYYEIRTIEDLQALSGFTEVTGNLRIEESNLTSLDGLKCLTSLGGELFIASNDSLTSLKGLENLPSVGGYLSIASNNSLTSLAGLKNLASVGVLIINDNDSLPSLKGLKNLASVGGRLWVTENHQLCTSLAEDLRDQVLDAGGIGGSIDIYDNKDC